VANVGDAARSIRSAVSSELRATTGQLQRLGHGGGGGGGGGGGDRGYSRAEALAARGGDEGRRLISGDDADADGDGGYGGYTGDDEWRRRPAEL
jgi:hypothetical protein